MLSRGQLDTRNEIFLGISAEVFDGQLTSCKDYRLGKILKHEGESRCRVSHSVGAMENDKTVIRLVFFSNNPDETGPKLGRHVAGVDGMVKLKHINTCRKIFHFGQVAHQMIEIQWLQSFGLMIDSHANGTACIDEQHSACRVYSSLIIHACTSSFT